VTTPLIGEHSMLIIDRAQHQRLASALLLASTTLIHQSLRRGCRGRSEHCVGNLNLARM
jgi:hypothetical protein